MSCFTGPVLAAGCAGSADEMPMGPNSFLLDVGFARLFDVVFRDVAGPAGFRVVDLQPGVAHGEDFQLVSFVQGADRFGGLVGLHAESHALFGLLVQGLGGDGVGPSDLTEVVFPLGDLVLAGFLFLQELRHHIAGLAVLQGNLGPAVAQVLQHPDFGAAFQVADDRAVRGLAEVQALAVLTVDVGGIKEAQAVRARERGDDRQEQGRDHHQDSKDFLYRILRVLHFDYLSLMTAFCLAALFSVLLASDISSYEPSKERDTVFKNAGPENLLPRSGRGVLGLWVCFLRQISHFRVENWRKIKWSCSRNQSDICYSSGTISHITVES